MTTNPIHGHELTFRNFQIERLTSTCSQDWLHPAFEIFRPVAKTIKSTPSKLYLVPTQFDDEYDPEFAPQPTSASELPELAPWVQRFAFNVVEIWAGRRAATQLVAQCHHRIFADLVRKSGSQKQVGHVRKIHIQEPLDGICEATITVRYENRLRAMILRFEGVDKRWLCTALTLL